MRVLIVLLMPTMALAETRCGWFDNPTPANYWLQDRHGSWTLSVQGMGDRGSGFFDLDWTGGPGDWVATNGSYGYGCACVEGDFDRDTGWATHVRHLQALPLTRCQSDPALQTR